MLHGRDDVAQAAAGADHRLLHAGQLVVALGLIRGGEPALRQLLQILHDGEQRLVDAAAEQPAQQQGEQHRDGEYGVGGGGDVAGNHVALIKGLFAQPLIDVDQLAEQIVHT